MHCRCSGLCKDEAVGKARQGKASPTCETQDSTPGHCCTTNLGIAHPRLPWRVFHHLSLTLWGLQREQHLPQPPLQNGLKVVMSDATP